MRDAGARGDAGQRRDAQLVLDSATVVDAMAAPDAGLGADAESGTVDAAAADGGLVAADSGACLLYTSDAADE